MVHEIFISYASADKQAANAICGELESRGLRCWIAPRDVPAGSDWPTEIARAIASSRVMVFVFSNATNDSRYSRNELLDAIDHRLTIIPVRIADVMPAEQLRLLLKSTHWMDAFGESFQTSVNAIAMTIVGIVGKPAPERVAEPAAQRRARSLAATPATVAAVGAIAAFAAAYALWPWSSPREIRADGAQSQRSGEQGVGAPAASRESALTESRAANPKQAVGEAQATQPTPTSESAAPTLGVEEIRSSLGLAGLDIQSTGLARPAFRVAGTVLNETELKTLSRRISDLEASARISLPNEVRVDPEAVSRNVGRELQRQGIVGSVVQVWYRPNDGPAYLRIRTGELAEADRRRIEAIGATFVIDRSSVEIVAR